MAEQTDSGQGDLAPGMTRVVHADETLVIQDESGQEFAIEGREAESTMEFLKAFDEWFTAQESGIAGVTLAAQWFYVKEKFNALPMRVQRQLPSFARGGVLLKDHPHA